MGLFILTIIALIACIAINYHKEQMQRKEDLITYMIKKESNLRDKFEKAEAEVKRLDEKRIELAKEFYHYRNLANELDEENKRIWNKYLEENMKNSALKRKNADLERENEYLKSTNDQLMDKIINHLKAKDIISNKKSTVTKIITPTFKIKTNEIINPVNNSTNWQTVNKHGFSINKMYEANPDYNPHLNNNKLIKTKEYKIWQRDVLKLMRCSNLKSLKELNVNPNKPMKIEINFKLVENSDTDNPIKAFIDTLVKYYGLTDDNNFYIINASRDRECARGKEMGQGGRIQFRISNI